MTLLERAGLALLRRMEPERAHELSLQALRLGLAPRHPADRHPVLATSLAGMSLPNPLGLAAGYDKNARAIRPLLDAGFGFVEAGAATPRPQPGNRRPRVFRLAEDRAVINRLGFNNDGADTIAGRLAMRPRGRGVLGLNVGPNRGSADPAGDYAKVMGICGAHVEFVTINVSSPNTEGLRNLQQTGSLEEVINRTCQVRSRLECPPRLFIKIAPDLSAAAIDGIAGAAMATGIDGIVATNTMLARPALVSPLAGEAGGLSGRPLLEPAMAVLKRLYRVTGGGIPLIGVGGIASSEHAYARIRAGASALQLYTGLVFGGFSLVGEILDGLAALLRRDGFASVSEAVGVDARIE